jgi:hypothetical protein
MILVMLVVLLNSDLNVQQTNLYTVDFLVKNNLNYPLLAYVTEQANSMRRSTVLSLSFS